MLGLLVIGLTLFMIYSLVKNALFGKQINSDDQFAGLIDLVLPVTNGSSFDQLAWEKTLSQVQGTNLRLHVLIDGHHKDTEAWSNLAQQFSFIEPQSFLTRPENVSVVPWMVQQVAHRLQGEVVMIGDIDLIPSSSLFSSLAKIVKDKDRIYFTLPQTQKRSLLGESVAILNPTLAFASLYGFRKLRRNMASPFLAVADGWFAFPSHSFKELSLDSLHGESWKLALFKSLDQKKNRIYIAFGEKHLVRSYPEYFEDYFKSMRDSWGSLWRRKDKKSFWFFIGALFVWSFPIICLLSYPIWALLSVFLLVLYRFFTKIVFQESWMATLMHPVACLAWITSLFWWLGTRAKSNVKR